MSLFDNFNLNDKVKLIDDLIPVYGRDVVKRIGELISISLDSETPRTTLEIINKIGARKNWQPSVFNIYKVGLVKYGEGDYISVELKFLERISLSQKQIFNNV